MKIALGSDHGGYEAKIKIEEYLTHKGYEIIDVGCDSINSCNYAEFGIKAAELVGSGSCDYGIVVCSSGEGISIAANKVKNVRCGIGYNDEVSMLLKLHNNANMIAFGAKFMSTEDIVRRTKIFLETNFEGGRHIKRVETITDYEK